MKVIERRTFRRQEGRKRASLVLGAAALGIVVLVATLAAGSVFVGPAVASAADACPWMDTSLSASQRARALLDASTLDQKLRWLNEQAANNPTQTSFSGGITMPAQVPCTPVIQYSDGPANVSGAGSGVTVFPAPIGLSTTWDPTIARAKGQAQAYEAFHKGRNVLLAPGMASGRDPRAGRSPEYLGEDPLLSGVMTAAGVNGMRDNPGAPVEAVLKHFVANEQELDRQSSSSNVDQRTLREAYTLPFEIAIRFSNPGGVMCSYNDVNGTPACGNSNTLTTILKDEIGLPGWVVTDFGARHSLTAPTPSLAAGLDQELNRWRNWTPNGIKAAIAAGTVTEQMVDQAAFRVVVSHIREGLFDNAKPTTPDAVVTSPEHKALSQDIAEKGAVLLKNDGVLPLTATGKTIAVIGQTASNTPTAGVSAATACGYTGPSAVVCTPEAPLDSITAWANANGGSVVYNNGADPAAAAATAATADVAVVFGYYTEGEGSDRTTLNLNGNGDTLIDAVASANPNTVAVLQTGGPVVMPWLGKVKGVLEVWYAGEKLGSAITNLLSGAVNPSGKLTMSFPKSLADVPTAGSPAQYPGTFTSNGTTTPPTPRNGEIRQVSYSEGLKIGYRWYDAQGIEPLFPFGFGLSYTTFSQSITAVTADSAGGFNVDVSVSNTGSRAGAQVIEVYVKSPGSTGEPSKLLKAFRKVTLSAGESKSVRLHLDPRAFTYWNIAANGWQIDAGSYDIMLGTSSSSIVDQRSVALPACLIPASSTSEICTSTSVAVDEAAPFSGAVASFTPYNPAAPTTEYTATVNWGDGSTPNAGTIIANGDGTFSVTGTHTYADSGAYTIAVEIKDAVFTVSDVSVSTTATVANVAPTATFNAPATVLAGSSFTLSLTNGADASAVDSAAGLQYAFDCGDGAGYGAFGSASTATCQTSAVATRTVGGKVRDKDGGTTEYLGTVAVIVTPQSLCNLTKSYVQSSPKYHALSAAAKAKIDAQWAAACTAIANIKPITNPFIKSLAVAAYRVAVTGLAQAGWLTPAQGSVLRNLAGSL